MNILILGSGGREHAFALKIADSKLTNKLYVAPGNSGTQQIATNIPININDFDINILSSVELIERAISNTNEKISFADLLYINLPVKELFKLVVKFKSGKYINEFSEKFLHFVIIVILFITHICFYDHLIIYDKQT